MFTVSYFGASNLRHNPKVTADSCGQKLWFTGQYVLKAAGWHSATRVGAIQYRCIVDRLSILAKILVPKRQWKNIYSFFSKVLDRADYDGSCCSCVRYGW